MKEIIARYFFRFLIVECTSNFGRESPTGKILQYFKPPDTEGVILSGAPSEIPLTRLRRWLRFDSDFVLHSE